jgi:hypothetical protein
MAGDKTQRKFRANRNTGKRKPAGANKNRAVVHVCHETLKDILIYINEENLVGYITYKTESGKDIQRILVYTWFWEGKWTIGIDAKNFRQVDSIEAVEVESLYANRVKQLHKEGVHLWMFRIEGKADHDPVIDCLMKSAMGKKIPVTVKYGLGSDSGTASGKPMVKPLDDSYLDALKDQNLAVIYLILLEHFARISVNEQLALGGLTKREYNFICKLKPKTGKLNPLLTPKIIARVLTTAYFEFRQTQPVSPPAEGQNLLLMTEAILHQRKCRNLNAINNRLMVANGLLRLPDGKIIDNDIGLKLRGPSSLLLYDRWGQGVPAYIGYMDPEYRVLKLSEIGSINLDLGEGLDQVAKIFRQAFFLPNAELYYALAGMAEYYRYIVEEICRIYKGEIQKQVIDMLPTAMGFFVAHALLGALARRGNIYAAAVLVAFKAYGWVMNVDMTISHMKKFREAGYHFSKMEEVDSVAPKEKQKKHLTKLSRYHLEAGTAALLEAIAQLAAQGIFCIGIKAGQKMAGPLAKYIKARRSEAKVEFHFKDGQLVKVRATRGKETFEVQIENRKAATGKMAEVIDIKTRKRVTMDHMPADRSGPNMSRRQRSAKRVAEEPVKILKMRFKFLDPKSLATEGVTGMPTAHLEHAIAQAKQMERIVLLRTTNPRGVQHVEAGAPPKPKKLIFLNTDPVTGKVTIKPGKSYNKNVAKAEAEGYYVLREDGFAYKGSQKLMGPDGQPVRFDMKLKGKYGEVTNQPGQVIDPKAKKALVGDYDVQDVIDPSAAGRNLATVPSKRTGDVVGPEVRRFMDGFNGRLKADGEVPRVVHGADAQFMQYRYFRKGAFKGDAIGIMPDGRVFHLTPRQLRQFYKRLGRLRLDIGKDVKLPDD